MNIFKDIKNIIKRDISFKPLLTVAGFILLPSLSWFYLYQSHINEEEQIHSHLQDRFQTLVSDFVADKHPEVYKIIFHKIWTKSIPDSSQIKVFFSYSLFTEGETGGSTLIEGEAILEKSPEQEELWTVTDFQTKDSEINFSEPLVIRAGFLSEDQ